MNRLLKGAFLLRLTITIISVTIFCLCGLGMSCDCEGIGLRLYESEYFIYTVSYDSNMIGILGLTDKGKEQEYLIIPETIDGMKVKDVGCYTGLEVAEIKEKYGDAKYAQIKSDKLKKVFIVSKTEMTPMWFHDGPFVDCPKLEAVFHILNQKSWGYSPDTFIFHTSLKGEKCGLGEQVIIGYDYAANVSYYYNYENSPNDGYYWIDNYGYGETIEYIPQSPMRDGYTFGGWYKEPECINVWDFTTDTIPQAQYDEDEKEIYQETKLYAKWTIN